jgi:hypothetical protein
MVSKMSTATARPWPEIRAYYENLGSRSGHDVHGIVVLLDWIRDERLEEEIFAYTSMFDLIISDRSPVQCGENTLAVSWISKEKKIKFHYHRLYASTDDMEKVVPEGESIEMLREFLTYKFGVYRKKKNEQP